MARGADRDADLLGAVGEQFFLLGQAAEHDALSHRRPAPGGGERGLPALLQRLDTRRQALERVPVGKVATYDLEFDQGDSGRASLSTIFSPLMACPTSRAAATSHGGAVGRDRRPPEFRQGPFGEREIATLERLVPHLQRAARLHLQMHE